MANFSIIEGDDPLEPIKDEFIRLYESGVKVKTICQELNISNSQYQNYRRRLQKRNQITLNRNPNAGQHKTLLRDRNNPKYYYWNRPARMWYVRYKNRYYACFKKETDAKRYVELMRECNWDYNQRWSLKRRVLYD